MSETLLHHFAPSVAQLRAAKGRPLIVADLEEIDFFKDAGTDYPFRNKNFVSQEVDRACNCSMSLRPPYSAEWMQSLFRMEAALKHPGKNMRFACPVHVRTVAADLLGCD